MARGKRQVEVSDAQQEQIQSMNTDGKTPDEIMDFFQQNYSIKLSEADVKKAVKGKLAKAAKRSGRGRGRGKQAPAVEVKTGEEFNLLIHQAFQIHKRDFIPRVQQALEEAGV